MEFDSFRYIVMWPLQIVGGPAGSSDDFAVRCQKYMQTNTAWIPANLYERDSTETEDIRYAEFVYFHPFVQSFLYGRSAPDPGYKPSLCLLRREDIKAVRIALNIDNECTEAVFAVDRVNLYIFKSRVALLAVEISHIGDAKLDGRVVLETQKLFRCAYTPVWFEDGPGLCPRKVEWLTEGGDVLATSDYDNKSSYYLTAINDRVPPVARHWLYTLHPMERYVERLHDFDHKASQKDDVFYFRQIEDERMPAMSFLALENPNGQISRGDWMRLTFLDSKGDSATLPYGSKFMADFENTYCYDRFWDPQAGRQTRYLCCGYAFTTVADSRDSYASTLKEHFRHHYFQMGLIAQFHRASLLVFSDRLSHARSARDIRQLQQEITNFVGEFWFKEVSNQVQPRELFQLWSKHLNAAELFRQVMNEKSAVAELAAAKRADRQTRVILYLTLATVVAAPFLLAEGLIPILDLKDHVRPIMLGATVVAALLSAVVWWLVEKRE